MSTIDESDQVTLHAEAGGDPLPAIDVKIPNPRALLVELLPYTLATDPDTGDKLTANPEFDLDWIDANLSPERQLEYWEAACADGVEQARELAAEIFPGTSVHQQGRSGGWLVVEGLGDVTQWDRHQRETWAVFCQNVASIVAAVPDAYLFEIHDNEWMTWTQPRFSTNQFTNPTNQTQPTPPTEPNEQDTSDA